MEKGSLNDEKNSRQMLPKRHKTELSIGKKVGNAVSISKNKSKRVKFMKKLYSQLME